MSMPPIFPSNVEPSAVQFTLGRLEAQSNRAQADIDMIRAELRDLPKAIREELRDEITDSLKPVEARIGQLETKMTEAYSTILKWRAVLGFVVLLGAILGFFISNVVALKKFVGG